MRNQVKITIKLIKLKHIFTPNFTLVQLWLSIKKIIPLRFILFATFNFDHLKSTIQDGKSK